MGEGESHWQTEAFTIGLSQGPGHLWELELEPKLELQPGLGLSLDLGIWSSGPVTLSNVTPVLILSLELGWVI